MSLHRARIPLAILPPLFLAVHTLSSHHVHSSGPSMLPSIPLNAVLLLDSRTSTLSNLRPGDVVAAKSAWGPIGDEVLKRIVALEGDFVEVAPLEAADADLQKGIDQEKGNLNKTSVLRIPKGHVWLEGDNRPWSLDSRHYGPVPRAMIEGKAVAVKDARASWFFFWMGWRWVR